MDISNIISLLGGVAMFLFGMSVMGDSLKKVAGSKMEMILYKLSGSVPKGILLGTGVTAVIQSSSATSVMVVGFVNSGMMKVKQAIGIVLGAILGTSVTGWILCLNSLGGSGASMASLLSTEVLTGIIALIGIILWMAAKKNYISQASLSQFISSLEQEYDSTLFDRKNSPITPTHKGTVFYNQAKLILKQYDHLLYLRLAA